MGVTDDQITAALANLGTVPYDGTWLTAPFASLNVRGTPHAVVARLDGFSAIGIDRATGTVWGAHDNGRAYLINTSMEAFVACSQAYGESARKAAALGRLDDEAVGEAFTVAVADYFESVDPGVTEDENSFWAIAASKLGYSH